MCYINKFDIDIDIDIHLCQWWRLMHKCKVAEAAGSLQEKEVGPVDCRWLQADHVCTVEVLCCCPAVSSHRLYSSNAFLLNFSLHVLWHSATCTFRVNCHCSKLRSIVEGCGTVESPLPLPRGCLMEVTCILLSECDLKESSVNTWQRTQHCSNKYWRKALIAWI